MSSTSSSSTTADGRSPTPGAADPSIPEGDDQGHAPPGSSTAAHPPTHASREPV
jgi:hypothetical protein